MNNRTAVALTAVAIVAIIASGYIAFEVGYNMFLANNPPQEKPANVIFEAGYGWGFTATPNGTIGVGEAFSCNTSFNIVGAYVSTAPVGIFIENTTYAQSGAPANYSNITYSKAQSLSIHMQSGSYFLFFVPEPRNLTYTGTVTITQTIMVIPD